MTNLAAFLPPVREAIEKFPQVFKEEEVYTAPLGVAWAPGRVNLIGEHTDYNGGYVLPLAVDRVTAFAGRARNDQTVRLWSGNFNVYAQFSLEGLPETFEQQRKELPGWARYVLGVITEAKKANLAVVGFDAVITGDVPLGGGMSSSAALEVATIQACAQFSGGRFSIGPQDATLTPLEAAALCQRAEQSASGVRSGILDQAASCLGQIGKAVLLDCRSLEYHYLPFEASDIAVVVIDTGVRRELASSAYNERRQQCEDATRLIREAVLRNEPDTLMEQQITELRDVTPTLFERYSHVLPEILRKRAGYIIVENERVLQVVSLLKQGKIDEVGKILWQGHAGLRDEYEVSCDELDALVEIASQVPGVLGARMMGGGFGGCTVNLVKKEAVEALQVAVERYYPERTGRQASIDICRAAGGPDSMYV